jgi:integrase
VGELLTEWLAFRTRGGIGPRTIEKHQDAVRLVIAPAIGTVQLSQLTTRHLDELAAGMVEDGKSTSTIRRYLSPLMAALAQAKRWEYITTDPAENMADYRGKAARPTVPVPAPVMAEMIRAAQASGNTVTAAALWLAYATGARPGELCALRWADVDTNAATLRLAASMDMRGNIGPTKTHTVRVVAVDGQTADMLAGLAETATGPLVLGGVTPTQLSDRWRKLCKATGHILEHGRPAFTLYGARHAQVTELLGAGVSAASVAARVGHSSPRTTLAVYAHARGGDDATAADIMGELMAG